MGVAAGCSQDSEDPQQPPQQNQPDEVNHLHLLSGGSNQTRPIFSAVLPNARPMMLSDCTAFRVTSIITPCLHVGSSYRRFRRYFFIFCSLLPLSMPAFAGDTHCWGEGSFQRSLRGRAEARPPLQTALFNYTHSSPHACLRPTPAGNFPYVPANVPNPRVHQCFKPILYPMNRHFIDWLFHSTHFALMNPSGSCPKSRKTSRFRGLERTKKEKSGDFPPFSSIFTTSEHEPYPYTLL